MRNLRSAILDILNAHRGEWLNITAVRSLLRSDVGAENVANVLCKLAQDGSAQTELVSGETVFRATAW
jgi:hypothetical protein